MGDRRSFNEVPMLSIVFTGITTVEVIPANGESVMMGRLNAIPPGQFIELGKRLRIIQQYFRNWIRFRRICPISVATTRWIERLITTFLPAGTTPKVVIPETLMYELAIVVFYPR